MDPAPEQFSSPPKPASAARTWLRILAWIVPGVASPALLLGWFIVVYGNPRHEVSATIAAGALLLALVLGCGFFNAILRPRHHHLDDPGARTKSIVLSVLIFFLAQLAITPALGFTVAFGCNVVTNIL